MKPKNTLRSLFFAGSSLLTISFAQADTRYWDGADSGPNAQGGVGNWDTSLTNWDTAAVAGTNVAFTNGDTAVFGGTAGAVTLTAPVSVGGLQFDTTLYPITADVTNTLSFSGTSNIILNNIAAATITGTVTGAGNVVLTASNPATAGTLTLNGTSADGWSGTTTINPGTTLALADLNQGLSDTTGGITLNGGGIRLTNVNSTEGALDRLNNSTITANSGTITYTNSSGSGLIYGETIGTVDLVRGQTNFALTNNMAGGGGNVQTLTLGVSGSGLTRTGASNTSAVSFGSASGLNTTTNIITVFGASGTGSASGQIVGPWASYGTTPSAPTDYAVYDASGRVLNASIGATAENTVGAGSWTTGNNVTLSGATTLTATRTVNTLRYTGGALALALGANNLETYGLLNGGSGLTVSGTGALTTPTGGGYLYLTPGTAAITVSAPINNNGGDVTVVKSGSNTLTLSSTTSNFSGGIVLNAGQLTYAADSSLGTATNGITVNGAVTFNNTGSNYVMPATRSITVNEGASFHIDSGGGAGTGKTFQGVLSGSGALSHNTQTGTTFSNVGNSFTGTVTGNISFGNLGDSSNPYIGSLTWTGGAKTFALRPLASNGVLAPAIVNNGSGALVFEQPLAITGTAGPRTLALSGSYTAGTNQFNGNIADGTSGGASVVTLSTSSTWALAGTNTYTGGTEISRNTGATLIFRGIQALSPSTSLTTRTQASGGGGANPFYRILDDSATPASRSGVNLSFILGENGVTSGDNRYPFNVFVGNNSTANGGTSASTQTNSTIQLGNFNFSQGATQNGGAIAVTGANGYKLQVNNINVTLQAAYNSNFNLQLLPTTGALIVAGNVRQANDAGASTTTTLQLDGTNTGNSITGNILNSAGGRLMNVSKAGTGTWSLSGINDYTGTTSVSAGRLNITGNSSAANGNVTVSGGVLSGNGGSLGGAVTVSNAASIDLRDGSVGSLTLGSTLSLTGSGGANTNNLYFDLANGSVASDQISVAGTTSVTTTGAAVIDLNWLGGISGRTPGTYTLIGGAGTLDATNFAKFALATTSALGQTYTLFHDAATDNGNLQVIVANVASATPAAFWAGGGTPTNNWSTTTNWRDTLAGGGAVAGAPDYQTNVTFSTTTPTANQLLTNVLDVDFDINSLTLTNASGNVTIGGTKTLTIEAAAVNSNTLGNGINSLKTSGTNTISAKVGLASSQTWTVATSGRLDVTGAISDFNLGNSLTKAGGGRLTLSGTNTYSGGTVVNGGILSISTDANLGATSGGLTFTGSATLLLGNPTNLNAGRTVTLNNSAIVSFAGNNNDYTIAIPGKVTGNGGIFLSGGSFNVVTLSNTTNDFTGPITIGTSGASGNQAQLSLASLGDSSSAIKFGTMTGNNTAPRKNEFLYTGPALTLNSRVFELTASAASANANIRNNGSGALTIIQNLSVTGSSTTQAFYLMGTSTGFTNSFAGTITNGTASAGLSLFKDEGSTWSLSGPSNSYSGGTTVSNGTLIANAASALGTGNVTVTAGTLAINAANAIADSAVLRLPSAAAKNLTMNANDTVASLFLAGVQQANGNYSFSTNASAWMNSGSGILTVGSVTAQPVYWDLDGAALGAGSATPSGTWNAGNMFWNNAAGDGTAAVWSAGATAAFSAGTNATGNYTVTVDGTQDIGGLTFEEGNVTLTGGTALRLLSNSLASVATGLTATIATPLTQDAPARTLTKIGLGTLTLANDNSYTGATTLSQGTLQLAHVNAIDNSTALSMATGTTLQLRSDTAATFNTPTIALPGGSANSVTINVDNTSSGTGNLLTLSSGLTLLNNTAGAVVTLNTTGGNGYSLSIPSLSITTSGGNNGGTATNLNPSVNTTIGTLTSTATTTDLQLNLGGAAGTVNTINTLTTVKPAGFNPSGNKNTDATWIVNNWTQVGGPFTVSAGTLTITGTLNVSGMVGDATRFFNVTGGTLNLNSVTALTNTNAGRFVMTGGTLDNTSGSAKILSSNPLTTWNGNFAFAGSLGALSDLNLGTGGVTLGTAAGTTRTVTVTNANTTFTVGGIIANGTTATSLTKAGAGTLRLSGVNSYTVLTTVSQGTLLTTKAAALPGYTAASRVSVANNATLAVNVDAGGWISGEIDSLLGATPAAFAAGSKLGIDITTGSFTYANDIGTTQAAKGLVKSGAGTLELTGANSYTGATAVAAGTLALGANNVVADTSAVSIGAATLNAATFTDTVGTLDITGAAVINLGTGGALAFADSAAVDWTGGTLNITGTFVSGASIRFGTTSGGLIPAQLAVISVNGSGAGTYLLDASGYLVTGGADITPPTLTSITDNVTGGPINIGATVTYTVTFNEDIDSASVTAADFDNTGAGITVGAINEISPGVFTVAVTANSAGSLKLRIPTGAVIEDVALNDLVVPVEDDTTITVRTPYETWANLTYSPALTLKLPGDDQDGDLLNNLREYAFGTNPTVNFVGPLVRTGGTLNTPGQPILEIDTGVYYAVFCRRTNYLTAGVNYTLQFSADMSLWETSATVPTSVATDSVIDAVRVPFPNFVNPPGGPGPVKPTYFRLVISN